MNHRDREEHMRKAIAAAALAVTLLATPALASGGDGGSDVIRGTAAADVLNGGGGADFVLGHAGADDLYGGPGPDLLKGGRGFDVCHVTPGDTAKGCEVLLAPPTVIHGGEV